MKTAREAIHAYFGRADCDGDPEGGAEHTLRCNELTRWLTADRAARPTGADPATIEAKELLTDLCRAACNPSDKRALTDARHRASKWLIRQDEQ